MTRCNCKFIAQVASGLGRADNAAPCAAANARPLPGPLATVELLGVTTTAGTGSDGGLEGGGGGGRGGGGSSCKPSSGSASARRAARLGGSATAGTGSDSPRWPAGSEVWSGDAQRAASGAAPRRQRLPSALCPVSQHRVCIGKCPSHLWPPAIFGVLISGSRDSESERGAKNREMVDIFDVL